LRSRVTGERDRAVQGGVERGGVGEEEEEEEEGTFPRSPVF
jgi:hypothetical protein